VFPIPEKVLIKWGRLFDIVKPSSRRTCCFTRGYTQLVERAGSVLQENEFEDVSSLLNSTYSPDNLRRRLGLSINSLLRKLKEMQMRYTFWDPLDSDTFHLLSYSGSLHSTHFPRSQHSSGQIWSLRRQNTNSLETVSMYKWYKP